MSAMEMEVTSVRSVEAVGEMIDFRIPVLVGPTIDDGRGCVASQASFRVIGPHTGIDRLAKICNVDMVQKREVDLIANLCTQGRPGRRNTLRGWPKHGWVAGIVAGEEPHPFGRAL